MLLDRQITGHRIRGIVLEQSKRANVGHIGSALSVADLIAVLYADVLNVRDPRDGDRDRFILSKGHAALALYAALFLKGWITADDLSSFCADGSALGVHPERALPGVDFSTGSLGLGLSFGAGAALAARLQRSRRRIFVLMSDAECNEGAVWEAAMFAAHHRLDNLVAIIDLNGQQALGHTRAVLDLTPMGPRWQAFGWDVDDVDGHDPGALRAAVDRRADGAMRPRVLVAHTVFGKGVSFMERQVAWHYLPMSDAQYGQALDELGAAR
jgi:transketolase